MSGSPAWWTPPTAFSRHAAAASFEDATEVFALVLIGLGILDQFIDGVRQWRRVMSDYRCGVHDFDAVAVKMFGGGGTPSVDPVQFQHDAGNGRGQVAPHRIQPPQCPRVRVQPRELGR